MDSTLFWTIFGAIGSSLGALIGAIALIIALKAYMQPIRISMSAKIQWGSIVNQIYSEDVYSIDVVNKGIRPVTVKNVSLQVADKTLFLDTIWQGRTLSAFEPKFPVRLDQGNSVTVYLPYDKFRIDITNLVINERINEQDRIYIVIRTADDTTLKFKTKEKVSTFVNHTK